MKKMMQLVFSDIMLLIIAISILTILTAFSVIPYYIPFYVKVLLVFLSVYTILGLSYNILKS
jgi:hypothetical protein